MGGCPETETETRREWKKKARVSRVKLFFILSVLVKLETPLRIIPAPPAVWAGRDPVAVATHTFQVVLSGPVLSEQWEGGRENEGDGDRRRRRRRRVEGVGGGRGR